MRASDSRFLCKLFALFKINRIFEHTSFFCMDKNQFERYKIIDRILRTFPSGITLKDLLTRLNRSLLQNGYGIERRQLQYDLEAMRMLFDAPITHKQGARFIRYEDASYSIITHEIKQTLRSMQDQFDDIEASQPRLQWLQNLVLMLQDTYFTNPMAMEAIDFGDNLEYENSGRVHEYFSYIVNKQVIEVKYSAGYRKTQKRVIHPYFLRQYNNRWFLFGWNEDAYRRQKPISGILNLALDRIDDVRIVSDQYRDISLDELKSFKTDYFEDIVGVTRNNTQPDRLVLRFDFRTGDPERDNASLRDYHYLKTKPFYPELHFPTDDFVREEGYAEVWAMIIPNKELEAILLRYADTAKIVGPENFKRTIIERINRIKNKQEL